VHDAPLVGRLEGAGQLDGDLQGLFQPEGAVLQPLGQGRSFHELHDDEAGALVFLEAVDGGEVGVAQGGQGPGFTAQPVQPLPVVGQLPGEDLDGHRTVEFRVVSPVDLAHAERSDDLVGSEPGARLHGVVRPGVTR